MTYSKIGAFNKNTPKSHKRQASVGLGIVTHLPENAPSKNNSFFEMTAPTQSIKPPPRLHLSSFGKLTNSNSENNNNPSVNSEEQACPPSFADRIRCIVLANRKPALVTPLTACGCESPSITAHFPNEKITPLPSPPHKHSTPNPAFIKHNIITPRLTPDTDDSPPTSAIPILSHSPNFSPSKTNIIPSLLEDPMLGDFEENMTSNTQNHKVSIPSPNREEDYLIGKHIWKFRIKELLGVGAFSNVFLADNLEEGGKFAVKMINKERLTEDTRVKASIEREVGVLKFLKHDHIVQLEATMETKQHLCIVLEYVQGEELFEFVRNMHTNLHREGSWRSIDEKLIRRLALELIDVVSWLHDHNIVHRDLKLENILVYYDDQGEPHLKITDFGLARVMDPNDPTLTTRCGSEEYAAPEIVQSMSYDGRLTDTWSIGIILYALFVGYLPFSYNPAKGDKLSHLFHRIVTAQVKWPAEDKISAEAKELVNRILVRQPEKRIRLDELRNLDWFKDNL